MLLYDCTTILIHCSTTILPYYYTIIRLYEYTTLRRYDFTVIDYTTIRLYDYTTVRLYESAWLKHDSMAPQPADMPGWSKRDSDDDDATQADDDMVNGWRGLYKI